MARFLKAVAVLMMAVGALAVLSLAFATWFDWNRIKPWINDKVSVSTGRTFAINGDLSFRWNRPPEQQRGWRHFVPWPHVQARDVTFGNAEWSKTGAAMAHLGQADITINPLALLSGTLSIRTLVLDEGTVVLEKDEDGKNNWTLRAHDDTTPSRWKFLLHSLAIKKGRLRYVDPAKKADVEVDIDTAADGTMHFRLGGKFNAEPVSGGGTAGGILALMQQNMPYPVQATLKIGETTINADGTLTDPARPSALDIQLKIAGASMSDLFPLSGLVLPDTPKFSTEGRVIGSFEQDNVRVRYESFQGRVGESDIGGTLEYLHRKPRPLLRGEVTSQKLWLKDLRALVGTDENINKRDERNKIPAGKVLPVSQFRTERWGKINVQVRFTGKQILRESMPIDNLDTRVVMNDGVLSLSPLDFGIAGGRLTTDLQIDGRSNPARARMKIAARKLRLKELMPTAESARASVGELQGNAELSASGNSIAQMLGSMNGEVKSLISEGSVSKFILEAAGLNIASAVIAKLFGDHPVHLNCMAADLAVSNGVAKTRTFLVDTADATIGASGEIDFRNEKLDLTLHPKSKGVRVLSLRSPLYVAGTFKQPDIGIDKGAVAARAGAAAVLGIAAAPLAALLALVDAGADEDSPCTVLLAQAGSQPRAPPPGKSRPAR